MADTAVTPFTTRHGDELVPNAVAHGGWGPTLGHGHMDPERAAVAAGVVLCVVAAKRFA